MTTLQEGGAAFALLAIGVLVILIAVFRPRWVRFIPGNTWFYGMYPAGRVGVVVGGTTLIIAAVWILGYIPQSAKGIIGLVWAFVIIGAAVYEMPTNTDDSKD